MFRLPVGAAAESRTDAAAAAGSSGEHNLQSKGSRVSAAARLPGWPSAGIWLYRSWNFFQQVGFVDGPDDV